MQINKLVGFLVIFCAVACLGCARIALYKNERCEGPEIGVKLYYVKPYLLVTQTDQNKMDVSIQYLPDLSKPIYAKLKSGYGSADLSLALSNGVLTNIGQKTDTKIPDTINALTGMATAAGGLLKALPPPKKGPPPPPKAPFALYEIDNSSGTTILKKVNIPINDAEANFFR